MVVAHPSPGNWGLKRKEMGGWEANQTTLQKQTKPAMNFHTVDARRCAENNANLSRQHSSVLHFATVVNFVVGSKQYISSMITLLIDGMVLLIVGFKVPYFLE